jgi:hypothetical protein
LHVGKEIAMARRRLEPAPLRFICRDGDEASTRRDLRIERAGGIADPGPRRGSFSNDAISGVSCLHNNNLAALPPGGFYLVAALGMAENVGDVAR